MPTNQTKTKGRDIGGLTVSCLLIIMAVVALWDTTNMMDADSYIFPRAIAIAMLVFNLLLVARTFLGRTEEKEKVQAEASTRRRVALIGGMLTSCIMMPYLGFLISGITTFFFLMLVSMYDQWTPGRKIIFPLVALCLVVGFYMLFSKLLLVPLPVGMLFE